MKKTRKKKGAGDTRQRILDCAETLFARQGYNGTSTRQIARAAGISIQTLQYHCDGKKNLYSAVLERAVVPVTDLVNRYARKMLERDLTDVAVLETSIDRTIDELFDLLHAHPNYALLFYRQWVVSDPELRRVEWDKLIPVLREWSEEIDAQMDEERLGGMNLFLFFMTLAWMYWGLFTQPEFIARYLGVDPASGELLTALKDHAREMTMRMAGARGATLSSTPAAKKTATVKAKRNPKRRDRTG